MKSKMKLHQLILLCMIAAVACSTHESQDNEIHSKHFSKEETKDKLEKFRGQPLFQHFATQIEKIFVQYISEHEKEYAVDSEEYRRRLRTFTENWIEVHVHNAKPGKWRKGINQFSDMTKEELDGYGHGRLNIHRPAASNTKSLKLGLPTKSELPKEVDWRKHGIITAVRNQGQCGSCWAHSAAEQLESYLTLETNAPLTNLSVQHITSCTPNPLQCGRIGKGGCKGGVEQLAYNYAEFMGIVREEDFPYMSGHGKDIPCDNLQKNVLPVAFTRGHETLPHNDYEAIMHHLAFRGPLSISVAANDWKSYAAGVFDGCSYENNMEMNHAVQLVGYGTDEVFGDYWLIRNSWGEAWGEDGYIRILRERETQCGVDTTPLAGSGCKDDGIKAQKVCGMCGVLFEASYPIGAANARSEVIQPTIMHA